MARSPTAVRIRSIEIAGERATNIAAALGVGGSRLDELEAPSKILILLTDGRHNVTQGLQPIQAAEALAALGIKVYTIGIGADESQRQTIFGLMGPMAADLDEPTLRAVAETTGGAYFRASDTRSLTLIYDQIDQLEPTTAEVLEYTHHDERYHPWLLIGLALLVLQQLLAQTWLRRLP